MDSALIAKYDRGVPRYTSYPTAPHFTPAVEPIDYRRWLGEIPAATPLSLYFHIPFCDSLCWFCGCHTKIVQRYGPIADYVALLLRELALVSDALGSRQPIRHLHFGGGSPSILKPGDVHSIANAIEATFHFLPDCEFALEVDPRDVDRAAISAWAEAGATRASIGVQDFDPVVQAAINREQSFDCTARAVDWLRAAGIGSVNIDLMYGLPHQTVDGLVRTVEQVLKLEPDRLAVFGYAHVPWMKRHQRMIPEATLPDAADRLAQFEAVARRLVAAGYVPIGLDHFAKPGDALAQARSEGRLHRNFQGYTADCAPVLLGLGASAIGALPQGYVQNDVAIRDWSRAVGEGRLATRRGLRLAPEDRLRRDVIERIMCDLKVDLESVCAAHGVKPARFAPELARLAEMEKEGLVQVAGWHIAVTQTGRPLLRAVCAIFDDYLASAKAAHSRAV
jgi:oxygen-independent coproporphyrinogen-3 oxidase